MESIIINIVTGVGITLFGSSILWLISNAIKNKEDIKVIKSKQDDFQELHKSITEIKDSMHKIEISQAKMIENIRTLKERE